MQKFFFASNEQTKTEQSERKKTYTHTHARTYIDRNVHEDSVM